MIPDLSNCKIVKGNLCCWDKEENIFFIVEQKRILDPALLKEVMATFINDKHKTS